MGTIEANTIKYNIMEKEDKKDFAWELKVSLPADRLAVARMGLSIGSPMHIRTSWGENYIQTPWQYYSSVYKEIYGVYPEFEGFNTLESEADEKFPC